MKVKGTSVKISGDKLRAERKRRRITQVDLAKAAGISQAMISKVEDESRNTSWEFVGKICVALNCDPGLITEEGYLSPYAQIIRGLKQLSDSQVEAVASVVREFLRAKPPEKQN